MAHHIEKKSATFKLWYIAMKLMSVLFNFLRSFHTGNFYLRFDKMEQRSLVLDHYGYVRWLII